MIIPKRQSFRSWMRNGFVKNKNRGAGQKHHGSKVDMR
jgi:hypothetical protein